MSVFYLDTSVAVRALLRHSPLAAAWIDGVPAAEDHVVVSSRILQTELTRVLRREGLPVKRRDEILDVLTLVPLTAGVRAASESIRTTREDTRRHSPGLCDRNWARRHDRDS